MTTTTTTTTAAERLAADYKVRSEDLNASPAVFLTDSRAAMLSWADHDGCYTLDDLEAILKGHGETLSAWVDDCDKHDLDAVYDAVALLTWLGY